jgi:hypothetical protein
MATLKERILRGKEFRKTVHLESLDVDVVIKPLTSSQFEELLGKLEAKGINANDQKALQKSLYKNIAAMRDVCKFGLADPDEAAMIDDIIGGDAVAKLGMEILAITNTSNEELVNFFKTPATTI